MIIMMQNSACSKKVLLDKRITPRLSPFLQPCPAISNRFSTMLIGLPGLSTFQAYEDTLNKVMSRLKLLQC